MSDHERPGTDLADHARADSPQAGSVALTGARSEPAQRPRRSAHPQDEGRPRSKPLILPPARLDQALAAEAARVRREVVGAREQQPAAPAPAPQTVEPEPAVAEETPAFEPEPEPQPEPQPAPEAAEPAAAESAASGPAPLAGLPTAGLPTSQTEELAAALREHPGLAAAFRAAAASAWPDDELEDPDDDVLDDLVPPSTPQAEHALRQPHPSALTVRPSTTPARTSAVLRPTGADEPHDDSVAGVAASVIASMRAVGEAHERHLESIELEAGRRSELLTAQAELDAELIRLHARREAHAIIAAARMRTGEPRSPVEADQLREIGETFSRFAESIESTIISGPPSTRGPRDL